MTESPARIEPFLLGPTPRRIRRRQGKSGMMGCIQIFIFPHTLVGIGSFFYALYSTLVFFFGVMVPGEVTGRGTSEGDDGTSYHLTCRYRVNGETFHASASASGSEYYSVPDGTPVQVKALPPWPGLGAQPLLPGHAPARNLLFPWLFTGFWNLVLSFFVYLAYVAPLRMRRLVSRGQPALGKIIRKEMDTRGESPTFALHYEFRPPPTAGSGGETVQGKMTITPKEYDEAREGDQITVLYDPDRPHRSVVYRFADYEAM